MRSVRWIAAASLLTGVWIGARNSALLGASRGGGEGTTCSVPARYSAYDGLEATLEAWAEAAPGEVFVRELATSRGGRSLRCLEIAPAPDGPRETDEKQWTVLLVGGLDGRSIASSLAVLRAGALLTERLPTLRRDVRVLLVPAASPDALADARAAKSGRPEGRNRRPFDDDGDGAFAEDPPDDLDGDGLVLDMLLEDPLGPWQLEGTPPRLLPAGERSAVRYTLVREGRDDDGDGRFNEDAEGGVRYDQHFPTGWAGGPGSARPLSEPVARALADLAVEEEVDLALVFGGEHGGLRFVQPREASGAEPLPSGADALEALFTASTGRASAGPRSARFEGHALAWLEEAVGARAVQVSVWGPIGRGAHDAENAPGVAALFALDSVPLASGSPASRSLTPGAAGPPGAVPCALEVGRSAWCRWIDEARGGAGFVDWHPIDVGAGRIALVGGFEPRTRFDPPEDLLPAALRGVEEFVLETVEALPRLDIEVVEVARHGDCVELSARVVNRGGLPLDLAGTPGGGELSLEVGGGGLLLAGAERTPLPALLGRASTERQAWLVRLPEGTPVVLRARFGRGREARREVRP